MTDVATVGNAALIDRFFDDVMNGNNPAAAAQLLGEHFLVHHSLLPHGVGGVQEVAEFMQALRTAFPDLHYTVDDRFVEDDKVAARWTATGTHLGPLFSIGPTHKQVTVSGNDIFRIVDGRLAETWVSSDLLGIFRQIGTFPPMSAFPEPVTVAS